MKYSALVLKNQKGFTLVELLTSALILTIAIVAIVSVVRKGRDMQIVDYHRRLARTIIQKELEQKFDYRSFPGPVTVVNDSVVIDENQGMQLKAHMSGTVSEDTITVSSTNMMIKKIAITLSWQEVDGSSESVTLSKWLANAK